MCQINNFISHLKKVVKEEQIKLKASKRKISDQWFSFSVTTLEKEQQQEGGKTEKINEIKSWLTEKIKKWLIFSKTDQEQKTKETKYEE